MSPPPRNPLKRLPHPPRRPDHHRIPLRPQKLGPHKTWSPPDPSPPIVHILTFWLDVPLVTPETPISFDRYLVPRGLQPGETALPEDTTPVENLPPLNPASYAQLQEMGFSGVRAEKALRMTGNGSAEEAMQWLFQHLEDDDIDVPFAASGTGAATEAAVVDVESLNNLMGMGFEEAHARKALQETVPGPLTYMSERTHDLWCREGIWNVRWIGYFLTLRRRQ